MTAEPTKVVLLGTAGGPLPSLVRAGIGHAVVAGDRTYLVDCGSGVTRQLRLARLLSRLHAVFLTHLHSDHTCDYFNLFLLGWPIIQWNPPVQVYGPGPAGGLASFPPEAPGHHVPTHNPANPTPGLIDLTADQFKAQAYDINVRMREAGRRDLESLVAAHEIAVPAGVGASAPDRVAPPMNPFVVMEDGDVRVTATLVQHAPVFPAFAFRFDTADGSVVFSGDTAPCPNLIALARSADILVHEVFDDEAEARRRAGQDNGDDPWEEERRRHHMLTSHTPLHEVGRIAAEAGVRRLVLTHFIPGDDMAPVERWIKGVSDFDGEVVVGEDLLELAF